MKSQLLKVGLGLFVSGIAALAQPYGLNSRPDVNPYLNGKLPAASDSFLALPLSLSQTGAFADMATLTPNSVMIPYTINAALWSDAASKTRWMIIPSTDAVAVPGVPASGTQIGFNANGEMNFPLGSVFVKHFDLVTNEVTGAKRRLETRVLVRNSFLGSGVYGVTYKWNEQETDAVLLQGDLDEVITITTRTGTRPQTWHYPSREQCLRCHTPASGGVLGIKTRQLNGKFTYPSTGVTDSQLRALNHIGLFAPALNEATISSLPRTVGLQDTSATLEDRVRSYLDANCSHCHRPSGPGPYFDARYDTPLAGQNLVDNNFPLVRFQDVAGSRVHFRAMDNGSPMPPLGRNIPDQGFLAVLSDWINSAFGITAAYPYGGSSTIRIKFNHPVDLATATQTANYTIFDNLILIAVGPDSSGQPSTNFVNVISATVGSDPAIVTLQLSPQLSASSDYTLKVKSVQDALTPHNTIWPNSTRKLSGAVQAVGDSFADSVRILNRPNRRSYTMNGSNQTATKEPGEPNHAGNAGGKSVWWNWAAPENGSVILSTRGSDFNTLLAVYTGGSVSSLTPVASNDDSEGLRTSRLSFDAVQGTLYQIAVDGYNGASGNIVLELNLGNDNFAARISIPSDNYYSYSVTVSGSNVGASKELNEPSHAGDAGGRSVWWSWVAPITSSFTIDTAGSDFNTLLAIYTGTSVEALTPVASNDDEGVDLSGRVAPDLTSPVASQINQLTGALRDYLRTNFTSRVTFAAVKGTVYQIAVDGHGGAAGKILLNLAVSNDTFDNRTIFPVPAVDAGPYSITLLGSNEAAGKEPNEPNHARNAGGRSVWYYWAARFSTPVTITTAGSDFDTLLAVYNSSSSPVTLSNLVEVASNDDDLSGGVKTSRVRFTPKAHTPYQIAVDGKDGAFGKIALTVSQNVPPKVSIARPPDRTIFDEHDPITFTAAALDVDGKVTKVEYFLPGSADGFFAPLKLGEATTWPYSVTWNNAAANTYSIVAVATDNEGAQTTSSPITIGVYKLAVPINNPPTVALTSPARSAMFTAPATINLAADARDSDGTISQVEFFAGTNLIGTATSAPYQYTWKRVIAGTYALTAKATDNRGSATISSAVTIFVAPASGPPIIVQQPSRQTVTAGASVVFTVKAEGAAPLTYQWQKFDNDLMDDGNFTGTTTSQLKINRADFDQAGIYTVEVSNAAGSVTSDEVALNVEDESIFVRRVLPLGYTPGQTITVILTARPPEGTTVYAIEDTVPAQWQIGAVEGGTVDAVNHKVKFGPFFDSASRTLSYRVTPPLGATGAKEFSGVATADRQETGIGGDNNIETVAKSVAHPADTDEDNLMTISEVTAYALAWRRGEPWPIEPEIIPAKYLTRAAALWKGGEAYYFNPALERPLCWVNKSGAVAAQSVVTASEPSPGFRKASADNAAVREMTATYTPGVPLTVTIRVTLAANVNAYVVEEQPPAGWVVSSMSDNGVFDGDHNLLKWGPFFDNTARRLTYQIGPPQTTAGVATFAGIVSFDGTDLRIIGQEQTSSSSSAVRPRLGPITRLPDGRVRLMLSGEAGRSHVIQASSDLITWTRLTDVVPTTGTVEISDDTAAAVSQRFYRAIVP